MVALLGVGFVLVWVWLVWLGFRVAASVPLSPAGVEPRGRPASSPSTPSHIAYLQFMRRRNCANGAERVPRPDGAGKCSTPIITGSPEQIVDTLLRQTRKETA